VWLQHAKAADALERTLLNRPSVFGFAFAIVLYAVTNVSGEHLNPAITAAFRATHRIINIAATMLHPRPAACALPVQRSNFCWVMYHAYQ